MAKKAKKLEFPPQKAYFIASFVLVNEKGQILLVKEKNNRNIWTVPGGEMDYKAKEQFLDTAMRETKEEVGISIKPDGIEMIDSIISYPEKDNPYKKYGIAILVVTFISMFPLEQKIKLVRSEDPLERKYDVKEYMWIKPQDVIKKKIKVHKNFIKTIPRIISWIKSGNN